MSNDELEKRVQELEAAVVALREGLETATPSVFGAVAQTRVHDLLASPNPGERVQGVVEWATRETIAEQGYKDAINGKSERSPRSWQTEAHHATKNRRAAVRALKGDSDAK